MHTFVQQFPGKQPVGGIPVFKRLHVRFWKIDVVRSYWAVAPTGNGISGQLAVFSDVFGNDDPGIGACAGCGRGKVLVAAQIVGENLKCLWVPFREMGYFGADEFAGFGKVSIMKKHHVMRRPMKKFFRNLYKASLRSHGSVKLQGNFAGNERARAEAGTVMVGPAG